MRWRATAALAAATVGFVVWSTVSGSGGPALAAQTPHVVEYFAGGSRLGVSVREAEGDQARAGGVLIEEVLSGSAAEQAGVRKGDVVVEFDGERVRSVRQFTRLVQETVPGRATPLVVLRDGQRTTLTVSPREPERAEMAPLNDLAERMGELRFRVAPRMPSPPAPPTPPPAPDDWRLGELLGGTGRLGITLSPLSPQLAEYFGAAHGVLVSSVEEGSAASKAGLRAGDVVTAVNGSDVRTPADLRRRIGALGGGDTFSLSVTRDRKTLTIQGTLEEGARRRVGTTRV